MERIFERISSHWANSIPTRISYPNEDTLTHRRHFIPKRTSHTNEDSLFQRGYLFPKTTSHPNKNISSHRAHLMSSFDLLCWGFMLRSHAGTMPRDVAIPAGDMPVVSYLFKRILFCSLYRRLRGYPRATLVYECPIWKARLWAPRFFSMLSLFPLIDHGDREWRSTAGKRWMITMCIRFVKTEST